VDAGWKFVIARGASASHQAGILDFIDQSTIADLEVLRRFTAVPLVRSQRFQDYVSFHFFDGVLGHALQRDLSPILIDHELGFGLPGVTLGFGHGIGPDQDVASHNIRKLSDISGPLQVLQVTEQFLRERLRVHPKLCLELLAKKFRQHGDILAPLPEGWQTQTKNVDPVKQILPESSPVRFLLQILIGSAQQPDVDLSLGVIADTRERSVLQEMKKLALEVQIEVGDLIQKQGTKVRLLYSPGLAEIRPGECPTFVSKQFAFEKRTGNRRAVYLDELSGGVTGIGVNPSSNGLFACSTLARQ